MLLAKAIPLKIFNKTPKHLSFKNQTFNCHCYKLSYLKQYVSKPELLKTLVKGKQ